VRLSIGLEDLDDLIEDIAQALTRPTPPRRTMVAMPPVMRCGLKILQPCARLTRIAAGTMAAPLRLSGTHHSRMSRRRFLQTGAALAAAAFPWPLALAAQSARPVLIEAPRWRRAVRLRAAQGPGALDGECGLSGLERNCRRRSPS
jgi:hypothetical protein